jgi:hypothetical protein
MPSYRGMSYLPDMGGGQNQNPFYNPYSPKPDYFGGIAATINNYMMAKQEQEDRQLKMQQAEMLRQQQAQQQAIENEYKRAQIEKMMAEANAKATPEPQPGEDFLADFQDKMGVSFLSIPDKQKSAAVNQYGAIKRAKPTVPFEEELGQFEQKEKIKAKYKGAGTAAKTPEQIEIESAARARGAAAGKPPLTEDEKLKGGATTREANKGKVIWALGIVAGEKKDPQKFISPGPKELAVAKELGVSVEFPSDYSVAKLNIADGVATKQDQEIVTRYDDMFRFYKERLAGKIKFKDFMKMPAAKNPKIDLNRIKLWYDLNL